MTAKGETHNNISIFTDGAPFTWRTQLMLCLGYIHLYSMTPLRGKVSVITFTQQSHNGGYDTECQVRPEVFRTTPARVAEQILGSPLGRCPVSHSLKQENSNNRELQGHTPHAPILSKYKPKASNSNLLFLFVFHCLSDDLHLNQPDTLLKLHRWSWCRLREFFPITQCLILHRFSIKMNGMNELIYTIGIDATLSSAVAGFWRKQNI